ncbi:MAG TPA: TetR/AcrR family transcriptional regulator [Mycobacterium sp.]|nr:TetR/AcrR family transcriptional regulator [Mycobacterium sp.]
MAPPQASGRLSANDWIQAGFAVLVDCGPNALRIESLCERLHVTKGSFYWHFTDIAAYRMALVEAWGSLHDTSRRAFETMPNVHPRERLAMMMQTLVAPEHWALERAMRLWALTDEAAKANVERSDGRVLRAVRKVFEDCGFEASEATLRSLVVFAAGIGLMQSAGPNPDVPAELRDRFLDFMLRP